MTGHTCKSIADFAEVQGGLQVTHARAQLPVEAPYLRVANVFRDRLDLKEIKQIRVTTSELERASLQAGDLLVVEGHGDPDEIGRCAVWSGEIAPCVHQNHLIRIRVDASRAEPKFISSYLNSPVGRTQLVRAGKTTSGLNTININNVRAVQVPLPPLPEQRRIADILDKADAIRRKRKEAITLTENLLRSAFLEMFGDPVTNPKGWPVKALGAVTQLYAGNSLPAGTSFEGQLGGVLLLKVGDMNLPGNELTIASAREWTDDAGSSIVAPAGAVVIPKRGGAIATNKKRVLLRPAALDPNLMAIAPNRDLALEYLRQWFELLDLSSLSSGSAVPQLNKKDLDPLPLPIPPMKLQTQFRTFAAHLEKIRQRMDAGCGVANNLFSSLVHRAFRGELTSSSTPKRKQLGLFSDVGGE